MEGIPKAGSRPIKGTSKVPLEHPETSPQAPLRHLESNPQAALMHLKNTPKAPLAPVP